MEQTLNGGLHIERIGRGHYLCSSRTRHELTYAIDILAHEGLGHCECEDFLYRRLPLWKELRKKYDHFRCAHLRAVRSHVMDLILAPYVAKESE